MADAQLNRRRAADPLRVQFFVTLGIAAVIALAMAGSAIVNTLACSPEALTLTLTTEWTPHP